MAQDWSVYALVYFCSAVDDLFGAVLHWHLDLELTNMTQEDIIRMAREAGLVGGPVYAKGLEAFAALVAAAERDAIYDQWHFCVMADLENGVKWLNEKAAAEWHTNYPAQSNLFPSWVESRGSR